MPSPPPPVLTGEGPGTGEPAIFVADSLPVFGDERRREVADELELRDAAFFDLEIDAEPERELSVSVPVDGEMMSIDLWTHSVRALGFRVIVDTGDKGTLSSSHA